MRTLGADLKALLENVLEEACAQVGLEAAGAKLLGYSMNAVYLLRAAPVVVRLRRGDQFVVERTIATARWLAERHAATVRLREGLEQPIRVENYMATFWEAAEHTGERFKGSDLALPLRELHGVEAGYSGFPAWEPFQYIESAISGADWLSGDDRDWLNDECARLRVAYEQLKLTTKQGLIHANAKVKNVLRDTSGRLILCDLDSVAWGPVLFDLVPTAVNAIRFGRSLDHNTLADAYGVDVTQKDSWPVLRRIRELETVAFWMTRGDASPRAVAEVGHRVQCLRVGDTEARWRRSKVTDRTVARVRGSDEALPPSRP